jgi:hypothetical protein
MERLNQTRKRSGDPCGCDSCTGRLTVYSTHIREEEGVRVQYLECNLCHWKPDNTVRVPLEFAPPRRFS